MCRTKDYGGIALACVTSLLILYGALMANSVYIFFWHYAGSLQEQFIQGIPLTGRGVFYCLWFNGLCTMAIISHLRAAFTDPGRIPEGMKAPFQSEYMEMKNNRDHVFGMYKKDENTYWLGTKQVIIDNDENITIDGYNYGNARGLWNFLMLNDPKLFTRTEKDENDYLSIVETTDLFNNPTNDPSGNTAKFKWLKHHMVKEQDEQEPGGSGIGNDGYISKLIQRLHLVVAERYAGNVEATTPVILQILKELKRVKYLDDIDIANTCKELCIPFGNPGTEVI